MGGAILEGWARAGAFAASEIVIVDPYPSEAAQACAKAGAKLNPPDAELAAARTVVLAVKPQKWLEAAGQYAAWLAAEAVIVSIAAGVSSQDISREFGGRAVARVMPKHRRGHQQGDQRASMPTTRRRSPGRTRCSSPWARWST